MIESLKTRLIESEQPVGIKKTSNWKLPPEDFAYGKKEIPDKEGASIVTRSWKVHDHSKFMESPQDFIKINKMAIENKAITHLLNKNFRRSVDIKEVIHKGTYERKIFLPSEEFVYGKRNRTPTPIKNVVNYDYSRKAEDEIRKEYEIYMESKKKVEKIQAKTTKHLERLLESKKNIEKQDQKPLYKMKMFSGIGSKVIEGIKSFKTYEIKNQGLNKNENIDSIIEKIEYELKEIENNDQKINTQN